MHCKGSAIANRDRLIHTIVRLSQKSEIIPQYLLKHVEVPIGVSRAGGQTDIFKEKMDGQDIAIKRFRHFSTLAAPEIKKINLVCIRTVLLSPCRLMQFPGSRSRDADLVSIATRECAPDIRFGPDAN